MRVHHEALTHRGQRQNATVEHAVFNPMSFSFLCATPLRDLRIAGSTCDGPAAWLPAGHECGGPGLGERVEKQDQGLAGVGGGDERDRRGGTFDGPNRGTTRRAGCPFGGPVLRRCSESRSARHRHSCRYWPGSSGPDRDRGIGGGVRLGAPEGSKRSPRSWSRRTGGWSGAWDWRNRGPRCCGRARQLGLCRREAQRGDTGRKDLEGAGLGLGRTVGFAPRWKAGSAGTRFAVSSGGGHQAEQGPHRSFAPRFACGPKTRERKSYAAGCDQESSSSGA